MKYFSAGILALTLIGLWHIRAITEAMATSGMGKPELIAQHIRALLYKGIAGSAIANMSYTIIFLKNFKNEHAVTDALMIMVFSTISVCSYAVMKIFMTMGGTP